VGYGTLINRFIRLSTSEDFLLTFPRFKITGWAPLCDISSTANLSAFLKKLPTFSGVEKLFAARPRIDLVLDISDDSRHAGAIRAVAPRPVTILTGGSLVQLATAVDDGRLRIGGGEGLRKAKNLFLLLMDQVEDDILLLDDNGIIREINHFAAVNRGLRIQECIGLHYEDLDPLLLLNKEGNCVYEQARRTGKKAESLGSVVLPDGRLRHLHALCYPVRDLRGGPPQYLYVRRDVTEWRQMEQRVRQTEKLAAIGELSTYMAHEIRNPLFSIGGFANALLRHPSLDEDAREKARIIVTEARRLDVILGNILNFARPIGQEMGVFEVESVVRQTLNLMTIGSEERGIRAEVILEDGLPKAAGNAENLKQCLINLIKNALEAMPGGGALTIRCRREADYVRISVEDTGSGIPPEIQAQVFNPFFSTKDSASGLGLAMTRKVIDDMGGKLWLKSQTGKGTTVALLLPAALALPPPP
jgi:PAS domain S-box-containing protein